MACSKPSGRHFVTRHPIKTKRAATHTASEIRKFYETHEIEVRLNPDTGQPEIKATKSREDDLTAE